MKNILLICILSLLTLGIKAQSITFNWNGSGISSSTSSYDGGTVQTWTVPNCVNSITITAAGAGGGTGGISNTAYDGGDGAIIIGTLPVTPGEVLDIMVGGKGQNNIAANDWGAGGGGGTFIWNSATSALLVAAGGGGGGGATSGIPGGPGANGQTINTSAAALAVPTLSTLGSCNIGGTGGGATSGGKAGLTTWNGTPTGSDGGNACGGAGWGENGLNVGPGTFFYTGFGYYPLSATTPGHGGAPYISGGAAGYGGYGGGAGGGFNGGGGGGGYNGGGGGNGDDSLGPIFDVGWGGGGGGSYFNGGVATSTALSTSGLDGSVTITWVINAGITPTATEDNNASACANNGSATGSASTGTAPYTYSWNTTPIQTNAQATGLSAGTYVVTITDAHNCTGTASVSITQPAPVSVTTGGITNVTCPGGNNGSAIATPAGGATPYTYVWAPNGGATPVGTNLSAGTYTVTVTDADGCMTTTTATISTINASPIVNFSASVLSGCAPLCTSFSDSSKVPGGTITGWNWSFGDGNTSTLQNPNDCFNTGGTYSVTLTATSNFGCSSTLVMNNMINAYAPPAVAFAYTSITTPNVPINFTDETQDGYPLATWLWTFGDSEDSTSTSQNTSHTYQDTGTYCPTLRVTDIHGCIDSARECLVVKPQYSLYIPNAFTPNGNGLNDVFIAKGANILAFTMYIFDRWGNVLYVTNDMSLGWNGTYMGAKCDQGVYVYKIDVLDGANKKHTIVGSVTLLR